MTPEQTVDLSSESNEWFSPPDLVEAFRSVMGSIDLDPCSNAAAQSYIRAGAYCALDHAESGMRDGLALPEDWLRSWTPNVFLNPPGGRIKRRSMASWWLSRWCGSLLSGEINQLSFVGFNAEILRRNPADFKVGEICIPKDRIRFWQMVEGKLAPSTQPTKWNALLYIGPNADKFRKEMRHWGQCYKVV